MCTGRPPFRASTSFAVLKRVAEDEPRPIREVIPEVPDWLCGIVAKLHAKHPADRFQTAREVADLLADCEAKLKAQQEVKNLLPALVVKPAAEAAPTGRKNWVAAAAIGLIPVVCLSRRHDYPLFIWDFDPLGPMLPESPRVSRGGAATSTWSRVRSSHRYVDAVACANNALGFRVAIVGDLKAKTASTGAFQPTGGLILFTAANVRRHATPPGANR